ncbi:Ubiquitin-associated domain [Dillenia turbinata]|uniref:Ubiquitin-associated domain n=1 Tax=Dillenia turbinata TaxID=194707 RepID=A0AAN8WAA7_9MAGN
MNGGPSGFNNAPVTRAFVIASAIFTIFFGIQRRSSKLGLSHEDMFKKLHLWKFIMSIFAFSSTPELMFGLYLLYYFRVFERQIGSNKYSVFIVFSLIVSLLLEALALALLKDTSLNPLVSGPYGLIFSSFVPFFFDIPVSTRFSVFGFHFSDKSFIYLAGLQFWYIFFSRPGKDPFYLEYVFPGFIASFFSRLSFPTTRSLPATRNVLGNMPSYTPRQGNYPSAASSAEPPEDSISTLVSMGFDRNSARHALVQARNDLNAATNILLESQFLQVVHMTADDCVIYKSVVTMSMSKLCPYYKVFVLTLTLPKL